ncbi:MAG: hypothetical protein NTW09_03250 [Candidatus Omnitrophica bacterium]|nr:hypothetical protein [Candidatus Omnitrophota bacterium]
MKKDKTRLGIDARIFSQPMNGVARHLILLLKSLVLYEAREGPYNKEVDKNLWQLE